MASLNRAGSVAIALGILVACALIVPSPAHAIGKPDVAALQIGLYGKGLYRGQIDGLIGPATTQAVEELQRQVGLPPDGLLTAATRAALGSYGQPRLGSRPLALAAFGWDVAELQFLLAWHGFPSGLFSGTFGPHLQAALVRYQQWAGLPADAIAGPATLRSLRLPPSHCPIHLAWPVHAPIVSRFGPRGLRFHSGLDLPAPTGTPVTAAAAGRVVYAGQLNGGWGNLVIISHEQGVQTMYAHLSRIDVQAGDQITTGRQLGLIGSTGDASGPHLHFEVRLRGAAVDPLPSLS